MANIGTARSQATQGLGTITAPAGGAAPWWLVERQGYSHDRLVYFCELVADHQQSGNQLVELSIGHRRWAVRPDR